MDIKGGPAGKVWLPLVDAVPLTELLATDKSLRNPVHPPPPPHSAATKKNSRTNMTYTDHRLTDWRSY